MPEAASSAPLAGVRVPRRPVLGLALVAATFLTWILCPTTVLEIRAGDGGPVVGSFPVRTGERIVYSYRHSIQTTVVDEILEVGASETAGSPGHLIVRETFYDMTGVGLPSDSFDGDFSIDPVTGKFHISNMSRDISPWRVRVGSVSEQTLRIHDTVFRLDSFAPPMTLLIVQPVSEPRLAWIVSR